MEIKKLIEKHDTQNQFKVLIESFMQIEYAWDNRIDIDSSHAKNINNIIVAGMGGSAIGGDDERQHTGRISRHDVGRRPLE